MSVSYKILLVGALGLASFARADSLRFGTVTGRMPWGTVEVANAKGYWAAEGLDVKTVAFGDYETYLVAVGHGSVDYGMIVLGDMVALIADGYPYKIIYEHDWSHGEEKFLLAAGTRSAHQLKDGKIGLASISASAGMFVQQVVQKEGLSIKDVHFRQITPVDMIGKALRKGSIVGAVISGQDALRVAESGAGRIISSTADFPGVMPEGIFANSDHLKKNPETAAKFLRGWIKALKWQLDPKNGPEYHRILCAKVFMKPYSEAELAELMSLSKIHQSHEDILASQAALPHFVRQSLGFLVRTGNLIKVKDVADYIEGAGAGIVKAELESP